MIIYNLVFDGRVVTFSSADRILAGCLCNGVLWQLHWFVAAGVDIACKGLTEQNIPDTHQSWSSTSVLISRWAYRCHHVNDFKTTFEIFIGRRRRQRLLLAAKCGFILAVNSIRSSIRLSFLLDNCPYFMRCNFLQIMHAGHCWW